MFSAQGPGLHSSCRPTSYERQWEHKESRTLFTLGFSLLFLYIQGISFSRIHLLNMCQFKFRIRKRKKKPDMLTKKIYYPVSSFY